MTRLRDERSSWSAPEMDLLSMLAHGEDTRHMDPMTFLGNLMLLIVGGNDTTRNSISGGVFALNLFPDEERKLRADPSLIPNMVAEIIRWQSPLTYMRRTALEDVELGTKTIRRGDKVAMWYLSGNRDEAVFEDADRLLIDRANARSHVSFGYGLHRCMGNRLAEMQLRGCGRRSCRGSPGSRWSRRPCGRATSSSGATRTCRLSCTPTECGALATARSLRLPSGAWPEHRDALAIGLVRRILAPAFLAAGFEHGHAAYPGEQHVRIRVRSSLPTASRQEPRPRSGRCRARARFRRNSSDAATRPRALP